MQGAFSDFSPDFCFFYNIHALSVTTDRKACVDRIPESNPGIAVVKKPFPAI